MTIAEIPKLYDPAAAEAKWFPFWEQKGYFNADPAPGKQPHVIMIPLPNVTGALHMGHALNGTLQDLITRWRRMQGDVALWMPGTDHAGIATQSMVEKRLREEENLTRHDIGREALVQRIWQWKETYEARIIGQLKRLGASCDWRRVRFTLDEVCSKAVRETFFRMFRDGLIYRGKRLVNWDAFLQTAVADDEVFTEDTAGQFWTFNYPVVDDEGKPTGARISFSTTRPETMLGDTAVCVHPTDERYLNLIGKKVRIPLVGRLIPIIADGLLADKELGTGCVKVTPAHDPNDYACGLRQHLPMINILNPDGTINEQGGPWQGLDRAEARTAVVAEMERLGHFEKVEERTIPMKYSDRSKTPIEPFLSDQWFVRMEHLAERAMEAVTKRRVQFFPERYANSYLDWLGEKRDWCISRQLWWGHRIPVWHFPGDESATLSELAGRLPELSAWLKSERVSAWWGETLLSADSLASVDGNAKSGGLLLCVRSGQDTEIEAALNKAGCVQDEDVLDTWFSSALWPHATLGWPDRSSNPPLRGEDHAPATGKNEVLDFFYPGNVLITSRDIITLWVARMVLTGLYNLGDIPFKHVHIHPKILDGFGQGMSKSKGNGVDPLELIEKYGCDGTRFTIASFAGETQDVRLPVSYECPHCQALIPQLQDHLKFKPNKPRIRCPKCKKESQYACPFYVPDDGEPVARVLIERFEYGRNFCNKLWNAARFAMMNLEGYTPGVVTDDQLAMEDRWILSRLSTIREETDQLLGVYKFDAATRGLRDFVWNEFCDWYLEMIKSRLREPSSRDAAQRVLVTVLDSVLRIMHPWLPFITEELWERLAEIAPQRGLPAPVPAEPACIIANWPVGLVCWKNGEMEARFKRLQDLIVSVRTLRGTFNISPAATLPISIRCSAEVVADLQPVAAQFASLAKADLVACGPTASPQGPSARFAIGDIEGFVPFEGLVDRTAELARQKKEQEKIRGFIAGHEKKLTNQSFVDKAPAEVVAEIRDTLTTLKKQLEGIDDVIKQLS